jgi:hypothetical protein
MKAWINDELLAAAEIAWGLTLGRLQDRKKAKRLREYQALACKQYGDAQ